MPSVSRERRVRHPKTVARASRTLNRALVRLQQKRTRLPPHDAMRSAPAVERRAAVTGRSRQLGLSGRGTVGWARLCRCLRCSTPTALSTPRLRRPDLSTPGVGSPVPGKCLAGGTPRTERKLEVRLRRGPLRQHTSRSRIHQGSLSLSHLTHRPHDGKSGRAL
jgi:hypothetical protein